MIVLMDVFFDCCFYLDVNSIMWVIYGKVEGYIWNNEQIYDFGINLDGVIVKYVLGDYEFDVLECLC